MIIYVRQSIKNSQFRTRHCTHTNAAFSTKIGRKVCCTGEKSISPRVNFALGENFTFLPSSIIYYSFKYLISWHLSLKFRRTVAGHYAATVFRADHAPSRYLLLLATGDERKEIANDAMLILYPSPEKKDHEKCDSTLDTLPEFPVLATYIHKKMTTRMERPASEKVTVGTTSLPYNITTFKEVSVNLPWFLIRFFEECECILQIYRL